MRVECRVALPNKHGRRHAQCAFSLQTKRRRRGLKSTPQRIHQQLLKIGVLGRAIYGCSIDPKIKRQTRIALRPHPTNPIEALHHATIFARPMPDDQAHRLRAGFIQRRVIHHQDAALALKARLGFVPQREAIRRQSPQQTGIGIMRFADIMN